MIELQHIVKRFDDAIILNDINVAIAEGTVTALVGPSGGGRARCCAASICWKCRRLALSFWADRA